MKELNEKELEQVAGGHDIVFHEDWQQVTPIKWPCPKCGSRNVLNLDPGALWQMRVFCGDCGFYGCRDGEANTLNEFERNYLQNTLNYQNGTGIETPFKKVHYES